jgi:low temperature requirement protein LtrA
VTLSVGAHLVSVCPVTSSSHPVTTPARQRTWLRPMVSRTIDEEHRAATPLELLFDLTFVVAVAAVAAELAHGIAEEHAGEDLATYLMAFFAIWWAWMNFTWFASAYDCDDAPYRLLTLVQMSGVLVLAAGVHGMFEDRDFRVAVVGYVIMRLALVAQWARAARSDPDHRATALRYVVGVSAVQVAWLMRLALPESLGLVSFLVLAAVELLIPVWAERPSMTNWHPHHIAERYGLFTIIVLGECVLAGATAVQATIDEDGASAELVLVGAGSLGLLFALWWVYFLKDSGGGLARNRHLSFWWGYGHYVVFASLAALGAGLEVAAEAVAHHIEASDVLVASAVAVPVVVFLVTVWALHAPMGAAQAHSAVRMLLATLACLAVVPLVALGLPLGWAVLLLVVPPAALVVHHHAMSPPAQTRGQVAPSASI